MNFKIDKKYIRWGITAFLVLVASISFYYILFHGTNVSRGLKKLLSVTTPILDGFLLAYLMNPILNFIERRVVIPLFHNLHTKYIRRISICLTVFLVGISLYAFFAAIIPQLIVSIRNIAFQFPIYVNNLTLWITKILEDNPTIEATVMDLLGKYSEVIDNFLNDSLLPRMNELIRNLSASLFSLLGRLWNLVIGFIISIYILGSKEIFAGQTKKILYALFEKRVANTILSNVHFTHKTFSGFIIGKVIDSLIIGIICFIGTSLMGTPYATLISVIVGVTNIIPFFGPYLGAIPSALLVLMVSPIQCLYFIIFIIILQQFDGNILGPKILGNSTGLSGFWVIFSITLFGGLFGIAGMVVGVPVFAIFYAGVKSVVNHSLRQKNLSANLEDYLTSTNHIEKTENTKK
ncbi:MAG: AI-2E family transporter [Lachnospiraceae bacterium]|nr:AI-2E family transporter [Lachnospiraceae bacterium]